MSKIRKFKLYNLKENAFHSRGNLGYTKIWTEAGTFYQNDAQFIKFNAEVVEKHIVHLIPAELSKDKVKEIVKQIRMEYDPEYKEAEEIYISRKEFKKVNELHYI